MLNFLIRESSVQLLPFFLTPQSPQKMSAQLHVDCPVAEFAALYTKLQPLLANFVARPRHPCKSMLEHFLIHHSATLEKAYTFESKVLALQAFVWSIVYMLNSYLTHILPSTSPESCRWSRGYMVIRVPPSQKSAKKPHFLESKDDELDELEVSPKTKPSTPSGSGKPNTGRGKTGGPQAKPKDPLASSKDKKQARSPSPERAAAKPNKKSKKTVDISAPPPETSGVPKWGDPCLKLPGKWPKGQEGMVEQDPDNLVDSRPHIRDDVDPEVYKGAEGQPFYLWKDVSSTIALPSGIRASMASLTHRATAICFTGPHSRSLPCTECYEKPQECTGPSSAASKCLSCSNNLPENGLNAFLEVAAQNSMSSQTMIKCLLTEIDFHREQVFDLDHAIFRLERLKKKTVTAHNIAQDTLKACCQDPQHIIHLLKTTNATFKMTLAQVDMLIACLGWESIDFNVEVSRTSEGDPMVQNLVEGREMVFLAPDSMAAVPRKPLSDPADLFSAAGDAQVATLSHAIHRRPVNLGSGAVVAELADKPEAPMNAPLPSPFTNPNTFVVGPTDLDTSLSEEGEIWEVPAAEESL
ncbi:hypothetical protein L218DRAFT_947372 [Marasmius fiardii PR-910]|nr:hypothetical protein L218DRAFT_947372 [Marasmius fiardii PR-910]